MQGASPPIPRRVDALLSYVEGGPEMVRHFAKIALYPRAEQKAELPRVLPTRL